MFSAVSIFLIIVIVFSLALILRLIISFHQDEGMAKIDTGDKGKRSSGLWKTLPICTFSVLTS